jgi:hypothetical protein
MAYGCLGIRLTLVMCLMLDIKLTLYQNFIYMVSYNRENSFQSYIIQQGKSLNASQNGLCWLLTLRIFKGENPGVNMYWVLNG